MIQDFLCLQKNKKALNTENAIALIFHCLKVFNLCTAESNNKLYPI